MRQSWCNHTIRWINESTKHIAACCCLVHDYAEKKLVSISYVPLQNMIADGMTNLSGRLKLEENFRMYGLQARSI